MHISYCTYKYGVFFASFLGDFQRERVELSEAKRKAGKNPRPEEDLSTRRPEKMLLLWFCGSRVFAPRYKIQDIRYKI